MDINIFEYATRNKLRFKTTRGILDVEGLWDIPLRSRDDFNLNAVAQAADKELKAVTEQNFVDNERTPDVLQKEVSLALVKHVIDYKKGLEAKAKVRAENKLKRDQILKAIEEKQAGKISAMSEEDLKKQLEALGD